MRAVATRLQESRIGEVCRVTSLRFRSPCGKGFPASAFRFQTQPVLSFSVPLSHPQIALDFLRADNNPLLTQKTRENLVWTPEEQSVTRWAIVRNRAPVVAGFILPSRDART